MYQFVKIIALSNIFWKVTKKYFMNSGSFMGVCKNIFLRSILQKRVLFFASEIVLFKNIFVLNKSVIEKPETVI